MIQAARSLANLASPSRAHHFRLIAMRFRVYLFRFVTLLTDHETDYFDTRPEHREESRSAIVSASSSTKRQRLRRYSLRFDSFALLIHRCASRSTAYGSLLRQIPYCL